MTNNHDMQPTVTHDCVAEAIAQEIADGTRHGKHTDTYARIYQAAYLGARAARSQDTARSADVGRGYCPSCACDLCQRQSEANYIATALAECEKAQKQ